MFCATEVRIDHGALTRPGHVRIAGWPEVQRFAATAEQHGPTKPGKEPMTD